MHARRLLPVVRNVVVAAAVAAFLALAVHIQLAGAGQYQVQDGDTLSQLAERLGVSVRALAEANGLTDPNFIMAGQMLVVPGAGSADGSGGGSGGSASTEYLVKGGDTLASISASVGIPVGDLMKANGLLDANLVPAGKLLTVPPVGGTIRTGPAVGGSGGTYKVREGDNLSGIASKLGVPMSQLASANGISNVDLIVAGQVITAPNAWLCPVPSAEFTNDYGYAEAGGGKHNGVDLFATRGTRIQAPVGGTVEQYPNPAGGRAVELYGNDGNRYYFAHLNDYGATGSVAAGDIIGYVGNSGDAEDTSTHLHFEIHPGGGASVNPYPTLVAACL